jgi:hypothetical protein
MRAVGKLIHPRDDKWSEIKCDACPAVGIFCGAFVHVPGEPEWELHYCRPCAVLAGWPWLTVNRPPISEQRSLFSLAAAQ